MWSAGNGDDNRRFLADLRALRDKAALEFDELAARAHYPSNVLKEAESGPSLPTLPILAAYVRACDADVPEWEERWRRLGFEADADPGLPIRAAGTSPAAVAGARAGVGVAPPESYDAERIRAVLRGAHGSSDRGARRTTAGAASGGVASAGTASGGAASAGTGWDTDTSADAMGGWGTDAGFQRDAGGGTSWPGFQPDPSPNWDGAAADVPAASSGWGSTGADLGGAPANGNHHVSEPADGLSETAVIETPDEARAEAIRRDPFSTAWLQDSELTVAARPRARVAGPGRRRACAGRLVRPARDDRPGAGLGLSGHPAVGRRRRHLVHSARAGRGRADAGGARRGTASGVRNTGDRVLDAFDRGAVGGGGAVGDGSGIDIGGSGIDVGGGSGIGAAGGIGIGAAGGIGCGAGNGCGAGDGCGAGIGVALSG